MDAAAVSVTKVRSRQSSRRHQNRRTRRIERLPDNGPDDRSFTLPGPNVLNGLQNHHWHTERSGERLRHHIGGHLGGQVRRLSLQRIGFIDRHRQGRAVDFAGRCLHDPLGSVLPGSFEKIQGAEHVRFHIGLRRDVRIGDRDQRREMKNDFLAVDQTLDEGCIADIATDEIDLRPGRFLQVIQPAVAVERIVLEQRVSPWPRPQQEPPSDASR